MTMMWTSQVLADHWMTPPVMSMTMVGMSLIWVLGERRWGSGAGLWRFGGAAPAK